MNDVEVGTCDEHEWAGVHVKDTYEYGDGDEFCRNFVEIAGFVHGASDYGNAFGGYNCTCGEPWLDTLGGCSVGGSRKVSPVDDQGALEDRADPCGTGSHRD